MKRIFIFFLALMLIPAMAFCSTTKLLDQDTDLRPQGWIAGSLTFKQGSQVELNENGEVISGVIRWYYYLRPAGSGFEQNLLLSNSAYFSFHKDTMVTFNEHGRVVSGTPDNSVNIYLIPYTEPFIKFKGDSLILFDNTGILISGTLADDTFLRPAGSGKFLADIKFKSGTEVTFGANARVIKGAIANDLTVNGKMYPAGTRLQFSESDYPQRN